MVGLLSLAQDLVAQAKRNPEAPIPVVLNLSSWAEPTPRLFPWLQQELRRTYRIPEHVARSLIHDNRLLLFLDGLDEVKKDHRALCLKSINHFMHLFESSPGIVVCSRLTEYDALPVGLETSKIQLLPLSDEAVDRYINETGLTTVEMKNVLKKNRAFRESLRSPLMLTFLRATYENPSFNLPQKWPGQSEQCERQILERYIKSRISSEASVRHYPEAKLRKWLGWRAYRLDRDSQSVFLLEKLQPSWLSTKREIRVYTLASRWLGTLIAVLSGVVIMWLSHLARMAVGDGGVPLQAELLGVQDNLWFWVLVTGVLGGLTFGFVDLGTVIRKSLHPTSVRSKRVGALINIGRATFHILVCALVFFVAARYRLSVTKSVYGALIYGVCFGMVFWFRRREQELSADIRTTDKISWLWSQVPAGALWGLLGGIGVGLIAGVIVDIFAGVRPGINIGAVILVGGLLVGTTVGGLNKVSVEERKMSVYEGLRLSALNTVRVWLYVGFLSVTVFWLYGFLRCIFKGFSRTSSLQAPLEPALFFGLVFGLLIAFAYSGLDIVYHITLRLVLSVTGRAPAKYVSFLNHASNIRLLHRAGGGYLFLHPLLLRQFVDAERVSGSESKPKPSKRGGSLAKYVDLVFSTHP